FEFHIWRTSDFKRFEFHIWRTSDFKRFEFHIWRTSDFERFEFHIWRTSDPQKQAASVIKQLQGNILKSVSTANNYEKSLLQVAKYIQENQLGSLRKITYNPDGFC
ncbi:hypothetical protein V0R57_22195, partial [Shewanella xiamenensis]|nr:hypothetical protein [Shewanella xiamenensis]